MNSKPDTAPDTAIAPDSPPAQQGGAVEVMRFSLSSALDMREATGIDGEYVWPHPPLHLAALFRASAEHSRAIMLKAEGAFGRGLIGAGANVLGAVCDGGASELFTGLGIDQECYGNAFLQIVADTGGRIAQLRRLPAITMSRYRGGFLQRVPLPNGERKILTFRPDEILHLKDHSISGRQYGEPSWIGAEGMLDLTRAATAFNAKFFQNNAMPEYAVVFEGGNPTEIQKTEVRNFFRREYQGIENAYRTMVLHHPEGQKVTFEKLTADMKDGDFLRLLDAARDRIVTAHGVPPRMLGIMAAGQLGGGGEITGQMFMFEHLTLAPRRARTMGRLQPILARLGLIASSAEDAMNGDGPNSNRVAFRPLDLTPPDQDIPPLAELVNAGIITAEEAHAILPMSLRPENDQSPGVAKSATRKTAPVSRASDPASDPIDGLAALLGRL